ncbi:glycosyl hydrolase [Streptomyces armeniacus]|uniref:Glycosyl hydrolase n=1 Tax=Streptomyces armeniacus TaxID=83291 RepID=A0A345XPK5_9ACTN|nr:glycosyl hydrolase [Streptomyces armeniacus]AXK33571.1 glycosyl hydrolase [Streptomyces armeniacus]
MRKRTLSLCVAGLLALGGAGTAALGTAGAAPSGQDGVAPNANANAKAKAKAQAKAAADPADVVDYLTSISGGSTVTGQHNREPNSEPSKWTSAVHDITGVYPGLWGGDFLFASDDVANRQTMIDQAETEWQNGSLATLTWHVCPPTRGSSCGWDPGTGVQDDLSDDQWNELVEDGTELNTAWKKRLDEAVPYLQQLQDAGVPALFRPIHEMNDGWSWWGGRPGENGSRKLYQITHDYLTRTKGLTNLVWVWNVKDVDVDQVASYYPGDEYVDVVSVDAWADNFPSDAYYRALEQLAGSKPMALAEVGKVPSPEDLARQPKWTYFMVWAEYLTDPAYNNDDAVRATYGDGRALNQGEVGPLG